MVWNLRYPIGRLVAARAVRLRSSKNEVVRRLGYRNPGKGARRPEHLLDTGVDKTGRIYALYPTPWNAAGLRHKKCVPGRERRVGASASAPGSTHRLTGGRWNCRSSFAGSSGTWRSACLVE